MKLTDHSASFSESLLDGTVQKAKIELINAKNAEAQKGRKDIGASSSDS